MLNKQAIRETWTKDIKEHQDLLDGRAAETIEKHRKGYAKLRVVDSEGKPVAGKAVTLTQRTHDFQYGANIFLLDEFAEESDNAIYRENFKKYFNLATVPFYWDALEPEQGKPRYDKDSEKIYRRPAPELCVEYCEENGLEAKLHCLVYEGFLPNWLPKQDMAAMEALYEERFRQIAERFAGRLVEFEVFNELACEERWTNQSVISQKRDIIDWAFRLARQYFPHEVLVANEATPILQAAQQDYRNPYFLLLEGALLRGVSIDKIGLQHHNFCGATAADEQEYEVLVKQGHCKDLFNPAMLYKGLDIFAELDLPLELTEITIPTFGETVEDEELQADLLEALYTVCFGHPAVETLVYWNTADGYAFKAEGGNWDENLCRGGLFHHDLTPKKAAERLWHLFNEKWHTDLTLITDENGYVECRGFYGDYAVEIDGETYEWGIHKNDNNSATINL